MFVSQNLSLVFHGFSKVWIKGQASCVYRLGLMDECGKYDGMIYRSFEGGVMYW